MAIRQKENNISIQRKLIEILRILNEHDAPLGARSIADELQRRGYKIGERAVRYHLMMLDEIGFTKKHGYSGRTITKLGLKELEDALVTDRLGFEICNIEELLYRSSFDPESGEGDVIVNISLIDKDELERTLEIVSEVCEKGLSVSPYIKVLEEKERVGGVSVPEGCLGIATLCSITIDAMLLRSGIPVDVKYGGILRMKNGRPEHFLHIIGFRGTSIDPIRIFISKKMTSLREVVKRGEGNVLANYREIPESAAERAEEIIRSASEWEIDGIAGSSFNIPVTEGKTGISIYAGVNGVVAAEEEGISINTHPIESLLPFREMERI
ncbi:MAG: DUF128 domain-containing protein [Candidatus Syntropharchaeia archaeon]